MKHFTSALALMVCLIIPTAINSTCIVILKTSNAIYVVADTRSNITGLNTKTKETIKQQATIQKIGHVGKYYFAISGHDDQTLMRYALEIDSNRSLLNNLPIFCEKIKKRYLEILKWEKTAMPESYKYFINNDPASVAFFTKEAGKISLYIVYFTMTEVNGAPQISYEWTDNENFVTLGVSDHIKKQQNAESYCYTKGVNGMVELIKLEAKNHKDKIGCPVDILVWESKPSITRRQCN